MQSSNVKVIDFDILESCTNRSLKKYLHKKIKKCLKICGEWWRSAKVRLFSSIYVNYFLRIFQSNSDHFVSITTQFFTQSHWLCFEMPVPCHLSGPFQAWNFVIVCEFVYTYTTPHKPYTLQGEKKKIVSYEAINV